jgi:predicted RNA-binding protein with RPS1 domain
VEIEKGVEGLIHVSEFSEERVEDAKTFVKPGQTLKAEIIAVDTAERKIGLSFRSATRAEELADAQGFTSGVPTATLGDVMRDKLAALTGKTAEDSGEKQGQGKNKKGKGAPAAETDDTGEDDES